MEAAYPHIGSLARATVVASKPESFFVGWQKRTSVGRAAAAYSWIAEVAGSLLVKIYSSSSQQMAAGVGTDQFQSREAGSAHIQFIVNP